MDRCRERGRGESGRLRAILLCLLLMWLPASALAGNETWVANTTGYIDIAADGSVAAFQLVESLGSDVDRMIRRQVDTWRFKPVIEDGQAIPIRARVSLELQAVPSGQLTKISISEAQFFEVRPGSRDKAIASSLAIRMAPPSYPPQAQVAGLMGKVVLVLRISDQGKVVGAEVERLDLLAQSALSDRQVREHARQFEAAARSVLPQWRFRAEEIGIQNGVARVRVPIAFTLDGVIWGRWHAAVQAPARGPDGPAIVDLGAGGGPTSTRIALLTELGV